MPLYVTATIAVSTLALAALAALGPDADYALGAFIAIFGLAIAAVFYSEQ